MRDQTLFLTRLLFPFRIVQRVVDASTRHVMKANRTAIVSKGCN